METYVQQFIVHALNQHTKPTNTWKPGNILGNPGNMETTWTHLETHGNPMEHMDIHWKHIEKPENMETNRK